MNFHSVFCCPVLKQQTRNENPPLLLPCGHALCYETVNRLSKGNDTARFKCPYCPSDTIDEAIDQSCVLNKSKNPIRLLPQLDSYIFVACGSHFRILSILLTFEGWVERSAGHFITFSVTLVVPCSEREN